MGSNYPERTDLPRQSALVDALRLFCKARSIFHRSSALTIDISVRVADNRATLALLSMALGPLSSPVCLLLLVAADLGLLPRSSGCHSAVRLTLVSAFFLFPFPLPFPFSFDSPATAAHT